MPLQKLKFFLQFLSGGLLLKNSLRNFGETFSFMSMMRLEDVDYETERQIRSAAKISEKASEFWSCFRNVGVED